MAETEANSQPQIENSQPQIAESEEQKLKYLEFVQLTALQAILYAARLYDYAKNNSGPLKPGVQTVEGTVKTVVGPVYNKFHDVPLELLKFVDRKVDESFNKIESRVPPLVKQVSTQAVSAAQKAPAAARNVASEVKSAGVVGTASGLAKTMYTKCEPAAKELYTKYEPAAKELYIKYEPVAEQYAASTWRSLNRLPLFPMMTQVLAPTASYYSEKYNQTVQLGAEKGYKLAEYLPLVPTEKIAKIVRSSNTEAVASD